MQSRIWPESYDPEGPCAGFSRLAWRLLGNDRSVGGRPLGNGPPAAHRYRSESRAPHDAALSRGDQYVQEIANEFRQFR